MTKKDAELKKRALAWKNAGAALRAVRRADIRKQDNMLAIDALNSLFRQTITQTPLRESSGLVEMYKVLTRQSNG